ncbi:MAG: hypothetical protein RL065_339, partial [Bacteroidota bacterium]
MKHWLIILFSFLLVKFAAAQTCNVAVNVNPNPATICSGSSINLFAFGTAANYSWSPATSLSNTSIPNPVATPTITTTYQVIASCFNGLFDTSNIVVVVNQKPTATFSFSTSTCSSVPILFSPNISGGTPPYQYNWSFGSASSSLPNPSLASFIVGCSSVSTNATLIVTDSKNCTSSSTQIVNQIGIPNQPILTDSNVVSPFKNCSSVSGGFNYLLTLNNSTPTSLCLTNFTINWGDGSSLQTYNNPTSTSVFRHFYNSNGIYQIVATAFGTNGCSNTDTFIFKNLGVPKVGISASGNTVGCLTKTFCYHLINYQTNLPGTKYRWHFSDGTPDVIWNYNDPYLVDSICHTYTTTSCTGSSSPGNFPVEIWAINDCDSAQVIYTGTRIFSKPVTIISPLLMNSGCVNIPVNLGFNILLGLGNGCPVISYKWTIRKYNSSYRDTVFSQNPIYLFPYSGKYNVKLSTSNICGVDNDSFDMCIDTTFTP